MIAFKNECPTVFERVQAVWRLEAATAWYITFDDAQIVTDFVKVDIPRYFCFCFRGEGDRVIAIACDQRRIVLRVSWRPILASSQGIRDDLIMFADVHSIAHEIIDGIMTGVRIALS